MGKAAALREEAIALFNQADQLVDTDGSPSAENQPRFDEFFGQGKAKLAEFQQASALEGNVVSLREALQQVAVGVRGPAAALPFSAVAVGERARTTPGQQFTESEGYKALLSSGVLESDLSRIGVQARFKMPRPMAAATDVVHTGTSGAATDLVRPFYLPDVIPLDQRPRTVRALFSQDTAPDGPIRDARQTAFDNAAAAVAQSTNTSGTNAATGVKPQSSVGWELFETNPITIATWMAASRQAVGQVNRLRSLIDDNGRVMIELEEEDQILSGNGTPPNMSGLLDQDGLQEFDASTISRDTANLDAIRIAKRLIRTGPARVNADAVVLNPVDSEAFDLLQDSQGRYRAGDPFGNGAELPPIWRLTRVESEAVEEGTAIVGAFKLGGIVYDVTPLVIYVSDSHADFFIKNLLAILFEERIAFVCRRPTAFVVVTLADWDVIGS